MVHFQTGVGTDNVKALCNSAEKSAHRCLTDCDTCEGSRDTVTCPDCLRLARQIHENLTYFFRSDAEGVK